MVRIAQVNMYLHQFKNPQIFQYDTLTSEERWNDKYDVILANPPFMSPRGGIRPHNKFGVTSNRAEVLFVDYIINHLKPNGRAGIVVPEGVIFQSGNAYKALRKNLVENGLFAVVSLPGGVFQPYSGVKTSILLIDNEIAKQKSQIAFVKITADGFDLGSSKRAVSRNDLPEALDALQSWASGNASESEMTSFVDKSDLAEGGDYNLSGDRYRRNSNLRTSGWPLVPLGELVDILNGFAFKSELYTEKGTRIIRITNVQKGFVKDDEPKYYPESLNAEISRYFLKENDLLVSLTGNVGRVALLPNSFLPAALNQRVACLRVNDKSPILEKYLYHVLNLDNFEEECISASSGVAQKNLSTEWLKTFEIPLPPHELQKQIVAELDGYAAIITGAKQIVDNWKPIVEKQHDWDEVEIAEVCTVIGGGTPDRKEAAYWGLGIPWLSARYVGDDHTVTGFEEITKLGLENSSSKIAPANSTILVTRVSVGKYAFADKDYAINQDLTAIVSKSPKLDEKFLSYAIGDVAIKVARDAVGIGVTGVTRDYINKSTIPLPPISTQLEIVRQIEHEKTQIQSAKALIEAYEARTQTVIAKLWNSPVEVV
jgi:type I restriction enzyme M protein